MGRHLQMSATRKVGLKTLMKWGAHVSNPSRATRRMPSYFGLGKRHGKEIIDLDLTLSHMRRAMRFLGDVNKAGGSIMVVSHDPFNSFLYEQQGKNDGYGAHVFMSSKWPAGFITNPANQANHFGLQMQSALSRKQFYKPDAIVFTCAHENTNAIREAYQNTVPVIALVEARCDPVGVDFPIPVSNSSLKFNVMFAEMIMEQLHSDLRPEGKKVERKIQDVIESLRLQEDKLYDRGGSHGEEPDLTEAKKYERMPDAQETDRNRYESIPGVPDDEAAVLAKLELAAAQEVSGADIEDGDLSDEEDINDKVDTFKKKEESVNDKLDNSKKGRRTFQKDISDDFSDFEPPPESLRFKSPEEMKKLVRKNADQVHTERWLRQNMLWLKLEEEDVNQTITQMAHMKANNSVLMNNNTGYYVNRGLVHHIDDDSNMSRALKLVMRNPDHADSGVASHEMSLFKDFLTGSYEDIKETLNIVKKTVMPEDDIREMFPDTYKNGGESVEDQQFMRDYLQDDEDGSSSK